MLNQLVHRCFATVHGFAQLGERPLHLVYFVIVTWESRGIYSIIALCCATAMLLSGPLAKVTKA